MAKIFIGYRRDDTAAVAARLGTQLKNDLRLDNVFLDTQDIWAGDRWHEVLDARLRQADAVVVLVGPQWAGTDGRRIFESDDVVRWELRRALELACDLVPTMVDGARWPTELPPDLATVTETSFVDLDPADSRVGYLELLGDLFYKAVRREGDVVVVYDETDASAEVHLHKLAGMLTSAALGEEATELVRAATRGFAAIPLGEAAALWPEIVVLRGEQGITEELEARMRGMRRNGVRLRVVPATAAGVLALVVGGTAARLTPLGPMPTPRASPAEDGPVPGTRWQWPAPSQAVRVPLGAVVAAGAAATVLVVVGVFTLVSPGSPAAQGAASGSAEVTPSSTVAGSVPVASTGVKASPARPSTLTRTVTVRVPAGAQAPRTVTKTQRVTDTSTQRVTDTNTQRVTDTATQTATERVTDTATQTVTGTVTQQVTQTDTRTVTSIQERTETVTATETVTRPVTKTKTVTETVTVEVTPHVVG